MIELLITVDYRAEDYWSESTLKNKSRFIDENKDIHDQLAKVLYDEDYCTLSYNNRPRSNIYIDIAQPKGAPKQIPTSKIVGYMYRGKQNIENKNRKWVDVNFDVWVSIKKVVEFEFKKIEL